VPAQRRPKFAVALSRQGAGESGRDKILQAAADAFLRKGYDGTSIDDIADEMGATKGRVYHYYRSKHAVYMDVRLTGLELLVGLLREAHESAAEPADRVHNMIVAQVEAVRNHRSLMWVVINGHFVDVEMLHTSELLHAADQIVAIRQEIEALFRDAITEGVRQGSLREVDPNIVAKSCLAVGQMAVLWIQHEKSAANVGESIADLILSGLRK
jgi:AcrR family transcriptional regulator